DTYLFKTEKEVVKYKEILPENTPTDKVLGGEIGITNQAAKRMGTIGVRISDDELFGPTGERFSSTNIVGRIINPEKLLDVKEGETIYVTEIVRKQT
ncbi:MAG: methanogenesis marker 3 protein, partial [Methanosarcina thermophila]